MFQKWLFWPLFASIMGFAIGGSFFFGLYGPQATSQYVNQTAKQHAADHDAKSKKEEADEALAYYTLWLMVFTGILAVATVGLGGATLGLYLTGEKQIKLNAAAAAAQSRDMQASIDAANRSATIAERAHTLADRPWVALKVDLIEGLRFDPSLGCKTKATVTLLNIGRSPAIGLGYFIELCPSIEQAVTRHREMLDSTRSMVRGISFGHTRFPNDPLEREIPLFIDQPKIESGIKESESGLVEPYIVACVYYGLPTGGRFRHTSINRAIWLNDDTPGFAPAGYYPLDKIFMSSFDGGETT